MQAPRPYCKNCHVEGFNYFHIHTKENKLECLNCGKVYDLISHKEHCKRVIQGEKDKKPTD